MKLVQTINALRAELEPLRKEGKTIGLVPTMGALHAGHASLVKRAVAENDVVVVSDFVNPTQFNDKNDLLKYPRTLDADCKLLEACGAAYVFAPSVEEIYPEPDTRTFSYPPLDTVMEGKYRPGHFNGVCQIVSKLFLIVSSRNARLDSVQRRQAVQISKALFTSVDYGKTHVLSETKRFVEDSIGRAEGLRLEYFEIVDGNTLQPVHAWDESDYIVGCITVFCGDVRLIDNIKYKYKE